MTELTAFSYHQGITALHRLDVRFKVLFVIMLSLTTLKGAVPALSILTLVLLAAVMYAGLGLKAILKLFRPVIWILVLILVARAASTPGLALLKFKFVVLTREGFFDGLMVCWRLVLVLLISLAFIATTKPSAIKASVEWFLRPFPLIPEKRLAVMMSLLMRFLPVIVQEAHETVDAQRARGVANRRNPIYRIRKLAIPLLRRVFVRADRLAAAMEARCYSENRTDPQLMAKKLDWIALITVTCACVLIVLML